MAIMNTTKSMKMASSVLREKCEATKTNMKRRMAAAGCKTYETVKTMIPLIPGSGDDVVFVGLNGSKFYFMRGETVDMPEPLFNVLHDSKVI